MAQHHRQSAVGGGGRALEHPTGGEQVVEAEVFGEAWGAGHQFGVGHRGDGDDPTAVFDHLDVDGDVDPAGGEREGEHDEQSGP
jgi:hypothetical protein